MSGEGATITSWVALLRGVNVGGVTMRNAELASVFSRLGFEDARAVLASGNVVFTGPTDVASDRPALTARIERALADAFDYDAKLILVPQRALRSIVDQFPFDAADPSRQPWVVFCVDGAREELLAHAEVGDSVADPVLAGDGVVYWNPQKGHSTSSRFAKFLAKSSMRTRTTNRNLRTLRKLLD
ncbi:DUF1697 domain-containing protein [Microbacterium sp. C7(2022)]|uniref:DUF1697 domain-containing protein n=1 Tax=Microbacterium sp. C7(2022) TaxID=2992759 RepID=UPI00237B69EC|nr:DUF1697 domain-containing protein [Microbacterium sp. C7(2022)]MDE0545521.1 DUF1697 domain-containing protein [Microbacterium sp. C7(2022)]